MTDQKSKIIDELYDPNDPRPLEDVLALLDLETLEENLFRGVSPQSSWQRVFGGQVIGQAMVAAGRTVDDRVAHSLHAYFLRPGDPQVPIIYEVDRIRDGRSFTTRTVTAIQHGRAIFSMGISYQIQEGGLEHQFDMPDVPGPEDLPSDLEIRRQEAERLPEEMRARWLRPRPIEIRHVEPRDFLNPGKGEPRNHVWFRAVAPMPDDMLLQQCVLAYASDMTLLDTCILPHGISWMNPRLQSASLDHAMWFHHPFKVDDWLLYAQDSPAASGGRGINRGSIYTRDGKLVASVAQEGLIRVHEKK
ncbi:MAG: acyl-CoA thioesterase II [Alphaproteobacteria bacterium]|nr:MAG: acyl-CoA thioesterase II [Alphaproteobacteria bacterium]